MITLIGWQIRSVPNNINKKGRTNENKKYNKNSNNKDRGIKHKKMKITKTTLIIPRDLKEEKAIPWHLISPQIPSTAFQLARERPCSGNPTSPRNQESIKRIKRESRGGQQKNTKRPHTPHPPTHPASSPSGLISRNRDMTSSSTAAAREGQRSANVQPTFGHVRRRTRS